MSGKRMTERERLKHLIKQAISGGCADFFAEQIADYLLDKGVIVPRYKIGDKVYIVSPKRAWKEESVECSEIVGVTADNDLKTDEVFFEYTFYFKDFGIYQIVFEDEIYTTKEEAEQALKERAKCSK